MISTQRLQFTTAFVCFALLLAAVASLDDKCYIKPDVVVPDADVQFGLLLSLRPERTTTIDPVTGEFQYVCGSISGPALEQFLAAEWLVHRINAHNNGTGYIPGVKIGFQSLDDCGSTFFASHNAMTFLDRWSPHLDQCPAGQAPSGQDQRAEPLAVGFVGTSSSDIAMEVASVTRKVPLPVISMTATAPQLSNKQSYPHFLRTVPSDKQQMKAIADMLRQLDWTYIAVIHVNDTFGRSGSEILADQAIAHGICIHQTLVLTSDTLYTLSNELRDLLQKSLDRSLAVVFIGGSTDVNDLLFTIDRRLNLIDNQVVKYGLRIILASSESSSVDIAVFRNEENAFGEGTLAMEKVTVNMSTDLEPDMHRLINSIGTEKHVLVEEFAVKHSRSELFRADSRNPSVPQMLHAVMALVEGLRTVHTDSCSGTTGLCDAMVRNVESGKLFAATQGARLDYASMEPNIVPEAFMNHSLVVQFDKEGDITQPEYNILQFRKSPREYAQVGVYHDGRSELFKNQMHWLTPAGDTTDQVPSSVCEGRCDKDCMAAQNRGDLPLAIMPGTEGYIVGLFSIHNTDDEHPFKCGSFRFASYDVIVAEGFFYAVRRLRNITGLNFGAIGIDDCYSPLRSQSILGDLFSDLPSANLKAFPELKNFGLDQVVGVVACRSSGCTIPVAAFFQQLQINVVSYAASSPDLDDKANYPYFLRTVPSDVYQAEVMLSIIQSMGWEYAGLLYVNNNYGIKAMQAFKRLALESRDGKASSSNLDDADNWPGVCMAQEVAIEERESTSDRGDFFRVRNQLLEQEVKVVVFFGIDSRYNAFLKYLEDEGYHGDFIFLASEEWATSKDIVESSPLSARGSITLKVEEVELEEEEAFRQHLLEKQPSPDDVNIWFSEFWQHYFQCRFPGGFINDLDSETLVFRRPRICDQTLRMQGQEVDDRIKEQRVRHTIKAVFALGKGLKLVADDPENRLCERKFPCRFLRLKVDELTSLIREQSSNLFDKDGNGALGFEVFNIQRQRNGGYDYEKVGTFRKGSTPTFEKDKLRFYTVTGIDEEAISAKCTKALCSHCPAPLIPQAVRPPGTDSKSSDYQEPQIVIISLVAVLILVVLVAVAAVILCWCMNRTVLKKHHGEQIYDEPEHQVYQQYMDTHGFRFANLNIEPLLGANNNNNMRQHQDSRHPPGADIGYEQTAIGGVATSETGGYHNEAFVHDHVDSVSQIFSAGSPQRRQAIGHSHGAAHQPAMGTDIVRNRSRSFQAGVRASPSFSQRPLPVSHMGPADTMSTIMHDNMAYHDALSDVGIPQNRKMMSTSATPVHAAGSNSNSKIVPNSRSAASPPHVTGNNDNTTGAITPSSCSNNSVLSNTSGATINSSQDTASPFYRQPQREHDQDPGIVYYMQDQNGQLTATHINQLPQGAVLQENAVLPDHDSRLVDHVPSRNIQDAHSHAPPVMQQQISQQSDQSSVVNPDYGPYSQAAAVQKALQQIQQHQQLQMEQNVALQQILQQGGLQQLLQHRASGPPNPPTSQPPRSSIPRGSDVELQEMPGHTFFSQQQHHHQSDQQLHQPAQHYDHSHLPPPPHKASQYLFQALSPAPQQYQHQHQQPHHPQPLHQQASQPLAMTSHGGSHPSTPKQRRAADVDDTPLPAARETEIQTQISMTPIMATSSTPITASSDSEGYIDTAIGSSLSASPGVGLEAPVDLKFQPELSHDPRPPNDLYLESIDLSSTLPEVNTVSPTSRRRGNSNRPEQLALSVLNGHVSDV